MSLNNGDIFPPLLQIIPRPSSLDGWPRGQNTPQQTRTSAPVDDPPPLRLSTNGDGVGTNTLSSLTAVCGQSPIQQLPSTTNTHRYSNMNFLFVPSFLDD